MANTLGGLIPTRDGYTTQPAPPAGSSMKEIRDYTKRAYAAAKDAGIKIRYLAHSNALKEAECTAKILTKVTGCQWKVTECLC